MQKAMINQIKTREKKMANQIKVNKLTDKMLSELSEKRKKEQRFIKSKQDINAEAVEFLYKKEMKVK